MHKGWRLLADTFHRRFEVLPAVTDDLQDAVYRVRHKVYCEEFGFEQQRPDGREVDEYDAHSSALLIRDIPRNEFIACARIVHPDPESPETPLPFERTTAHALDHGIIAAHRAPRQRTGEISRLAVVSSFRRRNDEHKSPVPMAEDNSPPGYPARFPFILAGLYLGIISLANLRGVDRLYLLTEPRLAAHIARVGVEIVRIGGPVEHRGLRIPSMIDVGHVTTTLEGYLRALYEGIDRKIVECVRQQARCSPEV